MPRQKPGKSETVVRTPPEFLAAARKLLGITEFAVDLACCQDNKVAPVGISADMDSLSLNWVDECGTDWCWLNPPYDNIGAWAEKCLRESMDGAHIAFLVPASVGSNWWRDFVHYQADVRFLNGRLKFLYANGTRHKDYYPKDLALILYGNEPGYDVWNWRQTITPEVN